MAVARPEDERLKDEEVESALKELNTIGFGHTGRETTSTLGACLLEGLRAQLSLTQFDRLVGDGDALGSQLVLFDLVLVTHDGCLRASLQHLLRKATALHPRRRGENHTPDLVWCLEIDEPVG